MLARAKRKFYIRVLDKTPRANQVRGFEMLARAKRKFYIRVLDKTPRTPREPNQIGTYGRAKRAMKPEMPNRSLIDELHALYGVKAHARYGLEHITQLEHALQTAAHAEAANEPPHMIVAALLHDVGHLLSKHGENAAEEGIDNAHERIGAGWLKQRLGIEISEPVRLHVPAKRWLCAADPAYTASLAPDSIKSLALQGGPMSDIEASDFLRDPHAQDAIRLRRYDDLAKIPNAPTPDLAHFLRYLEA